MWVKSLIRVHAQFRFLRQCFDASNEFFSRLRGLGEGALEAMSYQCQLEALRCQGREMVSSQRVACEKLSKSTWGVIFEEI